MASLLPVRLKAGSGVVVDVVDAPAAGFAPKNPPPRAPPVGAAGVAVPAVAEVAVALGVAVVPWGSAGLGGSPNSPPPAAGAIGLR